MVCLKWHNMWSGLVYRQAGRGRRAGGRSGMRAGGRQGQRQTGRERDRDRQRETETERRIGARRSKRLAMWLRLVFVAVINELSVCLTMEYAHGFLFVCCYLGCQTHSISLCACPIVCVMSTASNLKASSQFSTWRRSAYSLAQHDLPEVPVIISSDEMWNEIHLSRDRQTLIRQIREYGRRS